MQCPHCNEALIPGGWSYYSKSKELGCDAICGGVECNRWFQNGNGLCCNSAACLAMIQQRKQEPRGPQGGYDMCKECGRGVFQLEVYLLKKHGEAAEFVMRSECKLKEDGKAGIYSIISNIKRPTDANVQAAVDGGYLMGIEMGPRLQPLRTPGADDIRQIDDSWCHEEADEFVELLHREQHGKRKASKRAILLSSAMVESILSGAAAPPPPVAAAAASSSAAPAPPAAPPVAAAAASSPAPPPPAAPVNEKKRKEPQAAGPMKMVKIGGLNCMPDFGRDWLQDVLLAHFGASRFGAISQPLGPAKDFGVIDPLPKSDPTFLCVFSAMKQQLPCWTVIAVRAVRASVKKMSRYQNEASMMSFTNETLLFHGTSGTEPTALLNTSDSQLNPTASSQGFYGRGIYLAFDPQYLIGGRYAHEPNRINNLCCPTRRNPVKRILLVTALLGHIQEMGTRVDVGTRQMCEPDQGYDSVRAGPHMPHRAGDGEKSSMMAVLYRSDQCLVRYVVDLEPDVPD